MDKEKLLEIIKRQLKARGLSASDASEKAVGNPYLISNMGRQRYGMPSTENLISLCDVLGLEFYIGEPRAAADASVACADEAEFAHIPLHAATLSAGNGSLNSGEHVEDHLAFRRDWLRRIGVAPGDAVLARIDSGEAGQSMVPTIHPGDMVLIDTSRVEIPKRPREYKSRKGPIYAFTTDEGARVKRIAQVGELVVLVSDNPDIAPEFLERSQWERVKVIGKVMWWGHTADE